MQLSHNSTFQTGGEQCQWKTVQICCLDDLFIYKKTQSKASLDLEMCSHLQGDWSREQQLQGLVSTSTSDVHRALPGAHASRRPRCTRNPKDTPSLSRTQVHELALKNRTSAPRIFVLKWGHKEELLGDGDSGGRRGKTEISRAATTFFNQITGTVISSSLSFFTCCQAN